MHLLRFNHETTVGNGAITRQVPAFFIFATLILYALVSLANATANPVKRMEPSSWWIGFDNPNLQLLLHGEGASALTPELAHPGVRLVRAEPGENPNYLFLDLEIAPNAQPGPVQIAFKRAGRVVARRTLELQTREAGSAAREGFGPKDAIYLITPDRFANGDPGNDRVRGMREGPNRTLPGGRHGGDIQGVIDRLDYIAGLGFTQIWLNPLLENDQPNYSYHGYATTDFYKVDPRYGANADMRRLADAAKAKGIGLIMDMIVNHVGSEHWWIKDPPSPDWIHFGDVFSPTNHMHLTQMDPHASARDRRQFEEGWFVETMPDLDQDNPRLAQYLIQNSIWWIEYAGLSGVRMDTYPYPDKDFMAEWSRRVMAEYPNFNIVGEEWVRSPAMVAYWQAGSTNSDGYVSHLPSLMDFPVQDAMRLALTEPEQDWPQLGLFKLYEMIGHDFLYPDPGNLVILADNHDMDRLYTQLGHDAALAKMALGFIATTRGAPQVYYGSEILMANRGTSDHGVIRSDFPGGWPGDTVNAFTGAGLSAEQQAFQDWTRRLFTWRKGQPAVHTGRLIHYAPRASEPEIAGVYAYGRIGQDDAVFIAINKSAEEKRVAAARYTEILQGRTRGVDILTGRRMDLSETITLAPRSIAIIDLD